MSGPLQILSLGAGVQSSTLLLMSCCGDLPQLDAAIFADTGWEPRAVYRHLEWLETQAAEAGIPIYRTSAGNIREDALRSQVRGRIDGKGTRSVSMPYFTLGPGGEKGMLRRQCTKEYKLRPITRKTREVAGFAPRKRVPIGHVEKWIGISADERRRVRLSGSQWQINVYPLIEHGITRQGCLDWWAAHGYPEPPRSSCVGCPYRSNAEWRWLKNHEPESWREAIELDAAIRDCGGMRGQVFLHEKRIPLSEVDLRTDVDKG